MDFALVYSRGSLRVSALASSGLPGQSNGGYHRLGSLTTGRPQRLSYVTAKLGCWSDWLMRATLWLIMPQSMTGFRNY